MGGSIVPVAPGSQATQLSGSNVNDTTIYNMSSTSAVWVGNSSSVAPNSGMRIGPLGTARWSKASGLAYACVDTGVLASINLNISNDISDPANPVDVATATAVALLAQGIPNVLVTNTLLLTVLNANTNTVIDVSGQASLRISILGTTNANAVLKLTMDNPTGFTTTTFTLTAPASPGPPIGNTVPYGEWEIPVNNANQLEIFSPIGNPQLSVEVVGSNRLVPNIRQRGEIIPRRFAYNGAFVAGATFALTPVDSITDILTRYNGPVKLSWEGSAAAIAAVWIPEMLYANVASVGAGALQYDRTGANITVDGTVQDWYHPPTPCAWRGQAVGASAAVSVILTVTPAGSGF